MSRSDLGALALCLVLGGLLAGVAQTDGPVNFASAANGGVVTGPTNYSGAAGQPPVANDGKFDAYAWAYLGVPLVIRLASTQRINTVEVALHHEADAWYRFVVEISLDGAAWQKVGERTEGQPRGYQSLSFPPTECRQVRITFTDTSIEARSYHVQEVGVFLLPDTQQPSPMRLAYDRWRKEGPPGDYEALLRFLGPSARMTARERERTLDAPRGQRLVNDLDADGDPDLADYVDPDPKHTIQPMLVRALDDDDDMGPAGQPDVDSDCYVADWRGDGRIDAALDYWDEDRDGDADRMDIYYAAHVRWHVPKLEVVVIRDIGDDDRMWHTRNFVYDQYTCQWLSDFNGDEAFCMFAYDAKSGQFVPFAECPFTHHDLDGDGVAELTMQFLGHGPTITSLRYSFDADNDTQPVRNRRDYDFSLNCLGSLRVTPQNSTVAILRNGEATQPYLDWQHARAAAEGGDWRSCRLCWDEVDNNVNPADQIERVQERWEGVGGYAMNEGNKRWETDKDCNGKMQLYYWSFDQRVHLYGAESGFINVDHNHDTRWNARINYADEDGDGYFDAWTYDDDCDGNAERTVKGIGGHRVPIAVPFDYHPFWHQYRQWVQRATDDTRLLIGHLRNDLREAGLSPTSGARQWWDNERLTSFYAPVKLWGSAECRRYYLDLEREELLLQARAAFSRRPWWSSFQQACNAGDLKGAALVLSRRSVR